MKYNKWFLVGFISFFMFNGCGKSNLTDRNNSLHSLISKDPITLPNTETVSANTILSHKSRKEGSIIEVSQPYFGKASVSKENELVVIYTPQEGFIGKDILSYKILTSSGIIEKERLFITVIQ